MPDDDSTGKGSEEDADTEVLSFAMTDRDDTDAAEDDQPQLTPSGPDAGFDGWLDDDRKDPYRELSEKDDPGAEVADWLAFARAPEGSPTSEAPAEEATGMEVASTEEPEDEHGQEKASDEDPPSRPFGSDSPQGGEKRGGETEESEEGDVSSREEPPSRLSGSDSPQGGEKPGGETDDEDDGVEEDEEDDTSEFDLPASSEDTGEIPVVEKQPPSPPAAGLPPEGGETDTSEGLPEEAADVVDEVPVVPVDTTEELEHTDEPTEPDELDAVVEMEAIELSADFAIEDVAEREEDEEDEEEPPPLDDFTEDDYLGAATQDHVELAAAVAAAEEEATEQVALSAEIPGLESTSVGFDDVVEETESEEQEEEDETARSSDLMLRVGTAVALVGALLLSLLWRPALIVFVLATFIVAAGEFYSALIHRRFKPMSLFGFLGIAGAALGTAAFGVVAIPVALALMTTVLLLFNAVSPRRDQPAANFSLTVLVAAWIGGLGAFAFDIIAAEDYQVLVIALVATVALVDIVAFFVGRSIGRRSLAPVISPKKTVEGLIAGALAGLAVGAAIGYLVEPIDLPAGLLLGAVVAVFAPIGDLAVSVVKRSLDIKDMGSILPGHGGLLDRIDAVIAVIPAVWVVLTWLALI